VNTQRSVIQIEGAAGTDPVSLPIRLLLEAPEGWTRSPRDRHKVRVFHSIGENPGVTRKELISRLAIRPGTISQLVQELVTGRLVTETQPTGPGERGRPEIPLYPNWMRWVAVSVFCVSMELHAVLINGAGQILSRSSRRVPSSAENPEIEALLTGLIQEVLGAVPDQSEVLGASLSFPGIVDSVERQWIFSARWPRLRHLSLHRMRGILGVEVVIRRQLDVLLEYAMMRDPRLRIGNTLLFHWGFGIGGAFASNGSVIRSSTGVFCQIGHVSFHPRSIRPCICGRIGCLETDAALWALAPEIERSYGAIPENEVDFVEFFASRPVASMECFRHALTSVAHALSHLQAILVPDRVLMYGPFLQNIEVFHSLTDEMRRLSPPFVAEKTVIEAMNPALSWHASGGTVSLFRDAYHAHLVTRSA
jgi:transcriptional regulator of PTS gene